MGKDYFSEEIGSQQTETKDYFSEEIGTPQTEDVQLPQADIDNDMRVSAKDRLSALVTGGITPMVGGAKNSEDVLPMLNGLLGGIAGAYLGKPNLGFGLGTALGEAEKQSFDKVFGDRKEIDINDILLKGGMAAASAKLFDIGLKTVGVSSKIIPEKARAKFFDKVLQAVEIGKDKLSSNFGKSIDRKSVV